MRWNGKTEEGEKVERESSPAWGRGPKRGSFSRNVLLQEMQISTPPPARRKRKGRRKERRENPCFSLLLCTEKCYKGQEEEERRRRKRTPKSALRPLTPRRWKKKGEGGVIHNLWNTKVLKKFKIDRSPALRRGTFL